jgi:hypothetical protein
MLWIPGFSFQYVLDGKNIGIPIVNCSNRLIRLISYGKLMIPLYVVISFQLCGWGS